MIKKLLLAFVVLVVLAVAGVWAWWTATEVDRKLADFNRASWVSDQDWDWMSSHGGDPRVQRAMVERLEKAGNSNPAFIEDYGKRELDHIGQVLKAHPPTIDDGFLRTLAKVVVAKDYPDVGKWFPAYASSPAVASELLAQLQDMTKSYYRWSEFPNLLEKNYGVLEDELDAHKVPDDDARVAAETRVSLRYGFPRCVEKVKRYGDDPRVTAACVEHVIFMAGQSSYRSARDETERVMTALAARKPEPTDALLDAICRYGGNKETDAVVKAWGPAALPKLAARRDAQKDEWIKTQASALLARTGGGGAGDVAPILQELTRWLPPPSPSLSDDTPISPLFETTDWGKTNQYTIDQSLASLIGIGPAGVEGLKRGLRDPHRPLVQVSAKALAKVDPKALIEEIRTALRLFGPQAQTLAELPMGQPVPASFMRETYTTEGRVVAEGLAALRELDKLPDDIDPLLRDAVSCPDSSVAQLAVDSLGKRLDTQRFVPSLFGYLSGKSRFSHDEIDFYVKSLTSRRDVAAVLLKTLDAMLGAAGGSPDRLPMIQKVVGLRAIAEVGDASAVPVLEKYAADRTGYRDIRTQYNTNTMRPTRSDSEQRYFADLAKEAIQQVRSRH